MLPVVRLCTFSFPGIDHPTASTMSFFSRKPKVTLQEFCRQFYETAIFPQPVGGMDMHSIFCETTRKNLGVRDPCFIGVEVSLFDAELRALQLEVFGIAWLHHVDEALAAAQSEFTQSYLSQQNVGNLWAAMSDYNQATARSASAGLSGMANANLDLKRVNFFDFWIKQKFDGEAVARAANRLGSGQSWKTSRTLVSLSFTFTTRLQLEINDEARKNVIALIMGFYNGAKEGIKAVKISN
jgi:hypothetical protein